MVEGITAGKGSLSEVMGSTSREIIGRIRDLAVGVDAELNNGVVSPVEIAAALGMIADLSRAGESIVERSAGIIFSKNPEQNEEELGENLYPYNKLLRLKIEQKLIPPEETTFTRSRLSEIIRPFGLGKAKLNNILGRLSKKEIGKEQAIDIIAEVLQTPLRVENSEESDSQHQAYDRRYLMGHCRITSKQLDDWARLVSHNWKTSRTINKEEADAIYGLSRLEKSLKPSSLHNV